MNEILDISKEFNLKIVEDAAESLGSFYKHKHRDYWRCWYFEFLMAIKL